jgi:hypothetical protein
MSVPPMNFTPAVPDAFTTPKETYVTQYEYTASVIVILSGLVILAIVFIVCGLFMKAEAHVKTQHAWDNGFLFQEVDS